MEQDLHGTRLSLNAQQAQNNKEDNKTFKNDHILGQQRLRPFTSVILIWVGREADSERLW